MLTMFASACTASFSVRELPLLVLACPYHVSLTGPKTYRISVVPLGPTGLDVGARAARLGAATVPRFYPSHEVGRKLRINPRVLGRITTNVWVTVSEEATCGCARYEYM